MDRDDRVVLEAFATIRLIVSFLGAALLVVIVGSLILFDRLSGTEAKIERAVNRAVEPRLSKIEQRLVADRRAQDSAFRSLERRLAKLRLTVLDGSGSSTGPAYRPSTSRSPAFGPPFGGAQVTILPRTGQSGRPQRRSGRSQGSTDPNADSSRSQSEQSRDLPAPESRSQTTESTVTGTTIDVIQQQGVEAEAGAESGSGGVQKQGQEQVQIPAGGP